MTSTGRAGSGSGRMDRLADEKRELEAELARLRSDTDVPGPDPALVARVRALGERIRDIDTELEQYELAIEIERQKDA